MNFILPLAAIIVMFASVVGFVTLKFSTFFQRDTRLALLLGCAASYLFSIGCVLIWVLITFFKNL